MQLSLIFTGLIAGGVLLAVAGWAESKILRLVAVLVTANFVISGLGISRNVSLVILVTVATAWLSISLYLKYKPRETEFGKEFMQDLKARVKVREALIAKELAAIVPVPAAVPATSEIVDLIELTEEEKVANLEKDAALAERRTEALLKKREAERKLQRAANEDAIEKARRLQKIERENNPPRTPPPMTPEEKVEAMADLKKRENLKIEELRNLGYREDSNAIDDVRASYEKELKKLLASTQSAK